MDHVTPICTVHISKKKTSMAGDRIIKKKIEKYRSWREKRLDALFFLWLGFPIFVLWACRRLWLMISAVVSIYFPLVSHISQQISPHDYGFHHFFRLNMSFMLALAFIHFFLPVSRNNFQGNSLFNNAFRGLDLSSYPLGMVLWQLFSYVSIFSIIHFTLKQLSRMYNPQRKLPTSVQNRFT